jgi:hypothetical protein
MALWFPGVPFLFLFSHFRNKYFLTTQPIIDIWNSNFVKGNDGINLLNLIKEKEVLINNLFQMSIFKIEGGDYEGVQSFS